MWFFETNKTPPLFEKQAFSNLHAQRDVTCDNKYNLSFPFHFVSDEYTGLVRFDIPTLEVAHLSRFSSSVLKAFTSSSKFQLLPQN